MFFIVANNAGLDLVNTRGFQNGKPVDLITDFEDLTNWLAAAGLIEEKRARSIFRKWSGTREAKLLLSRALELRESLASAAEALLRGRRPPVAVLDDLNSLLRQKSGWFELQTLEDGYAKTFHADLDNIGGLLVPIAESMADLLCYGDLTQIKKCGADDCVLVFYDTSKNHLRRWCSMTLCGNRAKVNAFYKRKRTARG